MKQVLFEYWQKSDLIKFTNISYKWMQIRYFRRRQPLGVQASFLMKASAEELRHYRLLFDQADVNGSGKTALHNVSCPVFISSCLCQNQDNCTCVSSNDYESLPHALTKYTSTARVKVAPVSVSRLIIRPVRLVSVSYSVKSCLVCHVCFHV